VERGVDEGAGEEGRDRATEEANDLTALRKPLLLILLFFFSLDARSGSESTNMPEFEGLSSAKEDIDPSSRGI
jgi:hypothetical protein